MNDFPLYPFLLSLLADGILLTLRDYARIQVALQSGGSWSITRLRDTLLALLAKDAEQEALFLRRFDDFFATVPPAADTLAEVDLERALAELKQLAATQPASAPAALPPSRPLLTLPPLPAAPKLRFGFWTLWAALLVLGLLVSGYWLRPFFINPPVEQRQPTPVARALLPTPAPLVIQPRKRLYTDVPYVVSITYEPLPSWERWHLYAGLAALFFFAALLYGLYLWRSRQIPEDAPPPYNPAGPRHFPLGSIGGQPAPRLNNTMLAELADSLGYFQSHESGHRLDVGASIQATLAAGGIPALAFHRRQQVRSLLILEDALAAPLAWNPLARELAEGIARYGVPVLYGRFYGSPTQFKTPDGATHRLEDLEDQRQGFLLLLCSDGKSLQRAEQPLALEALARWPQVAWLELREPKFWDEGATLPQRYGLPLYPATPAGALQAVRRFLSEQGATASYVVHSAAHAGLPRQSDSRLDAYVEQLLGDALLWAQECAMLQPVTPGLADKLRRTFHPHLPPERIERLYALPDTLCNVSGLRFSDEVQRILRSGFLQRRSDDEQEAVLRCLIQEIEQAEPGEDDSLAHLAWEAVRERVRLDLDQDTALARLAQLAKTPVGPAISQSLAGFGLPEEANQKIPLRLKPANPNAWQRLARIADGFNIPKLEAYPVGWGHRVLLTLLLLLFIGSSGLSIAYYLYPSVPSQNWQAANAGKTYALLKSKVQTNDVWDIEKSDELDKLTTLTLRSDREYQLVLFGGGHKTINQILVNNHRMMVIAVLSKEMEAQCQEKFPDIGLIIERCSESGNDFVRQRMWRNQVGDQASSGRLLSIGLEITEHREDYQELQGLRDLLLETSSVDIIYRIQPGIDGSFHLNKVFAQIEEDLGALIRQSQLILWTDTPIADHYLLDGLLARFSRVLELNKEADLAWSHKLKELLDHDGDDKLITEQQIRKVLGKEVHEEIKAPIMLIRPLKAIAVIGTPSSIITLTPSAVNSQDFTRTTLANIPLETSFPTPTPLALPTAVSSETLILIATFHTTTQTDAEVHTKLRRAITSELAKNNEQNIRVEIDPTIFAANQRAEAEATGRFRMDERQEDLMQTKEA